MEPAIVFQDRFILVLDKPAGMVVNRVGATKRETIQDFVEEHSGWDWESLKAQKGTEGTEFLQRAGLVHRLDKETSGLLLVAKTEKAFKDLQRQFKKRRVEKRYLALVHGKVRPKKGKIEVPLSRSPRDRRKIGVLLGGRRAKTGYKVVSSWFLVKNDRRQEFSLLELRPTTGRTHQIRVHLKFIGHPIVGDVTYAGRKTARQDRAWCPRQFLHAAQIAFTHPKTGKKAKFTSPLPADLRTALTHLGNLGMM